jgi:hypothetical protein
MHRTATRFGLIVTVALLLDSLAIEASSNSIRRASDESHIGHAPVDQSNRRRDLQGYVAWENHPVMNLQIEN